MFFARLRKDIAAAKKNDPAARNKFEIWLTYSGVHALSWHRWANRLYRMHFKLLARITSQFAKFLTGIEIHPAAKIAAGVFIDHGAGVVIGETAEVEEGVVIYQGVTLGGTGKEKGKRHPTIKKGATISCGAKVLGGFNVGEGARIPEKDDPILREVCARRERVYELEERLDAAIRYAGNAGMPPANAVMAPMEEDAARTETAAPSAHDAVPAQPPASDTGAGKDAENML